MIDAAVRSMGRTPLVLAALLALALVRQGFDAYTILGEKAAAQTAVTESVDRWKSGYLALGDTVQKWDASYPTEGSIQDQVSLIDELRLSQYGFTFDMDAVTVVKIDAVKDNGALIGLTKVCLSSGIGSEGLEVTAQSYDELLAGLKKLAARPDIYIGVIKLKGEGHARPAAVLGDFCLLLRKGSK